MHTEQQGIVVAVSPASALAARPRLFAALEAAFPVSFVAPADDGPPSQAAALIAFAPDGRLPAREDLAHSGLPVLALHGEGDEDAGVEDFRLQNTPGVDARLRDIVLSGRLARPCARPRRRRGPGRRGLRPGLDGLGGPGARAPRARRAAASSTPTSRSTRCSRGARWPRSPSSTSCAPSRRPPAGARRRCGRRCTSTTRTCAGAATASSTTASCSSTPTRTATTSRWRRSRSTPAAPTARRPRCSASAPIASRWSSTATTTSRAS